MKCEIETNKQKLQPALAQARLEFAQAEVDLEITTKRNQFTLCLVALILALIIGVAVKPFGTLPPHGPVSKPAIESPPDDLRTKEKVLRLSIQGTQLSREGKFGEAVAAFREAVRIDPNHFDSYKGLGYALYRLERYEESVEASEEAIELRRDFEPCYNSGLAYMELGRWDKATAAFESATEYINTNSWEEKHTLAYYHLGRSTARLGQAGQMIVNLEGILKYNPKETLKRLQLGSLYLWVGKREAARAQYKILKGSNPSLAEELLKLIKKHGIRA
jgi:tetratricopeptide (TPR) repeat protein